jgi:hypothetical protein
MQSGVTREHQEGIDNMNKNDKMVYFELDGLFLTVRVYDSIEKDGDYLLGKNKSIDHIFKINMGGIISLELVPSEFINTQENTNILGVEISKEGKVHCLNRVGDKTSIYYIEGEIPDFSFILSDFCKQVWRIKEKYINELQGKIRKETNYMDLLFLLDGKELGI